MSHTATPQTRDTAPDQLSLSSPLLLLLLLLLLLPIH